MKTIFNLVFGSILLTVVIIAFALVSGSYIQSKSATKITLPGGIYTAGEIIYPDYVHDDTLIVVDPVGLNKAIAECNGTDWGISTALYRHCAVLGEHMFEYGVDIDQDGYILKDRCYGNTIKVPWGTNFDTLMYNWND